MLARNWSVTVGVDLLHLTVLDIEAKLLTKRYEKMNVHVMDHLVSACPARVYRWMYYQPNNVSTKEYRDEKTCKIKQLVNRYSVEGVVMYDQCTNIGNMHSSRHLVS